MTLLEIQDERQFSEPEYISGVSDDVVEQARPDQVQFKDFDQMSELIETEVEHYADPNSDYQSPYKAKIKEEHEKVGVLLNTELRPNDHKDYFCEHCMRVARLTAVVAKYSGADEGKALIAGLLHDVGKGWVGKTVGRKSATGNGWRAEKDGPVMDGHSYFTYLMALDMGIDEEVAAAVAEHHALQERREITNGVPLSEGAVRIQVALHIADFFDARMNRKDDWSDDMSFEGKKNDTKGHIRHVFKKSGLDTDMADEVVDAIFDEMASTTLAEFADARSYEDRSEGVSEGLGKAALATV